MLTWYHRHVMCNQRHALLWCCHLLYCCTESTVCSIPYWTYLEPWLCLSAGPDHQTLLLGNKGRAHICANWFTRHSACRSHTCRKYRYAHLYRDCTTFSLLLSSPYAARVKDWEEILFFTATKWMWYWWERRDKVRMRFGVIESKQFPFLLAWDMTFWWNESCSARPAWMKFLLPL